MSTKTDTLLQVLHVLAWVAFIGLMIEAGIYLFIYVYSLWNPEAARNVYSGLDLSLLLGYDRWHYTTTLSFLFALSALKAYIACLVIRVLSKMKIGSPFTREIAERLGWMGQVMLGTWITAVLYNAHTRWLMKRLDGLELEPVSTDFLFLVGVVFVIAQVFKRGVELQTENELTV